MDCEHPAHTEEIKAKTVLPTSAEEVQSISTHQLCVLAASSLCMRTVSPVTAVPPHQSSSPYSVFGFIKTFRCIFFVFRTARRRHGGRHLATLLTKSSYLIGDRKSTRLNSSQHLNLVC